MIVSRWLLVFDFAAVWLAWVGPGLILSIVKILITKKHDSEAAKASKSMSANEQNYIRSY
jgi:hypothetical protein